MWWLTIFKCFNRQGQKTIVLIPLAYTYSEPSYFNKIKQLVIKFSPFQFVIIIIVIIIIIIYLLTVPRPCHKNTRIWRHRWLLLLLLNEYNINDILRDQSLHLIHHEIYYGSKTNNHMVIRNKSLTESITTYVIYNL